MAWQKVKLGDIAIVTSSKRFHLSERSDSGVPFYCSKQIIQKVRGELVSDYDYIREEFYENVKKQYGVPEPGDLLITTRGSYGVPYIYKDNDKFYFADGNLTWLKDFKEDIDVRFLYYWICSYEGQKKIDAIAKGTAQKAVTIDGIKNLEISVPSFKTQKRIADILSAYDNLIENNQKQIKLLEEAAQRLYKQWFIDLRYPGHETIKIVDGLPEGWRKVTLGSALSKITTGLNPRKNFVLGQGKNFYVTIKNMGDNNIYLDDKCDRVNDEALEKINKRSDLKTGDILFSGIGTIGRVYLIDIPTNNWNVSESVFTMRVNECVPKEFLYLMLLSDDVQSYCDLHAHGVAQRGIRMADLKEYKFVLPENKIIDSFTTMVEPIIEKTQILRKSINYAAESRDRLLPRLMNGELCL